MFTQGKSLLIHPCPALHNQRSALLAYFQKATRLSGSQHLSS